MDYRELVKELRKMQSVEYCVITSIESFPAIKIVDEAADAIEELENKLNLWRQDKISRWIPVTERLPEEYKSVLCYYEYFRYGDFNCMFRTIDVGYYCHGVWGGEAGKGRKNKVLAWMPLPEPPRVDPCADCVHYPPSSEAKVVIAKNATTTPKEET